MINPCSYGTILDNRFFNNRRNNLFFYTLTYIKCSSRLPLIAIKTCTIITCSSTIILTRITISHAYNRSIWRNNLFFYTLTSIKCSRPLIAIRTCTIITCTSTIIYTRITISHAYNRSNWFFNNDNWFFNNDNWFSWFNIIIRRFLNSFKFNHSWFFNRTRSISSTETLSSFSSTILVPVFFSFYYIISTESILKVLISI